MSFRKEYLDLVLVPSGLIIMFGYHLWYLYRCLHLPHTTVIGFENNAKKAWVDNIQEVQKGDYMAPVNVLASNITTSTFLAAVCLTLCSLIGTWIANNSHIFQSDIVYGDIGGSTMSIKYISLLLCFLLAFTCFVQSARLLIHANYLISMPQGSVPSQDLELAVIRGGDFWSLGLRAIYFALILLVWFLGPIPMFATSVAMVFFLHFLDTNTRPLHRYGSVEKKSKARGLSGVPPPADVESNIGR